MNNISGTISLQSQEAQEPGETNSSSSEQRQSGWLSGAVKGFSEAFASFTAMFKTSGSSILSQSKNASLEGAAPKNTFSSLRDWGSSFSLRNWIPKGISWSFGKQSDEMTPRDSSFSNQSGQGAGLDFFDKWQLGTTGFNSEKGAQQVKEAFSRGEFQVG